MCVLCFCKNHFYENQLFLYIDLETTLNYASVMLGVMCFVSIVSGVTMTCGVFELALPSRSYVY